MKVKMNHWKKKATLASATFFASLLISISAEAEPVTYSMTASGVDWTSAGISGVGGGSGDITVGGVTGTVQQAFLYWHGVKLSSGSYDNATVMFDGNEVTGTSLGEASSNCWGAGYSQAFRADVSAFVSGDGTFTVSGLSDGPGYSANGASLVVLFDDGNSTNNRDLAFFTGNDSNYADRFPGETDGWFATLDNIDFGGGSAFAEFHVADGQSFGDGSVTLTTSNGQAVIADNESLWDGNSLPDAGTSRTDDGLYDIHKVDIADAFGDVMGPVSLDLEGQLAASDCLGLVLVLIDLEAGSLVPVEDVAVPMLSNTMLAILASAMLLLGLGITRKHQS